MKIIDSIFGYLMPYLTLLIMGLVVVIVASVVQTPFWLDQGLTKFVYSMNIFTFYVAFFFIFGGFVALVSTTSYAASRILTSQSRTGEDASKVVERGMRFKKYGIAMTTAGLTLLVLTITLFH